MLSQDDIKRIEEEERIREEIRAKAKYALQVEEDKGRLMDLVIGLIVAGVVIFFAAMMSK